MPLHNDIFRPVRSTPGKYPPPILSRSNTHNPLWLALRLPGLSLQALGSDQHPNTGPETVYQQQRGRPILLACNRSARAQGVHAGMSLNAARALCPHIHARPRQPEQEQALLRRLAGWSGQFSAWVHLAEPASKQAGLLLEVAGSLHLFGGRHELLEQISQGLSELGYHARLALAPTPTAAWWLARDGRQPITGPDSLQQHLGRLPITVMELPGKQQATLAKLGITSIADCLALPREGLARRLDPHIPLLLDRACGRAPDPRPAFRVAEHFAASQPLLSPLESSAELLLVVRRLILELAGFLLARGSGVQQFQLQLQHHHQPTTRLHIGLSAASRDPEHLLSLARRRLERVEIQEPVIEVGLLARQPVRLKAEPGSLFNDPAANRERDQRQLLENLRARMGRNAVTGLCLLPDHRPERAWGCCEPGEQVAVINASQRPLWLLDPPQALDIDHQQRPRLGRLLTLEHGPERIETGWWDHADVARDYYVARHPDGERLWIFQRRDDQSRWFLHGLFG